MKDSERDLLLNKFGELSNEALERLLLNRSSNEYSSDEYDVMEMIIRGDATAYRKKSAVNKNSERYNDSSNDDYSTNAFSVDAKRLYFASQTAFAILMVMNLVIAGIGIFVSYELFSKDTRFGLLSILLTGFICFNIHIYAILSTHFGKVIANISIQLSSKVDGDK